MPRRSPDVQLKNLVLSSTRHLDTFLNLVLGFLIFNLLVHTNLWSNADTFETGSRRISFSRSAFAVCNFFFFISRFLLKSNPAHRTFVIRLDIK